VPTEAAPLGFLFVPHRLHAGFSNSKKAPVLKRN
jgi:hypothetical protein